MAAAANNSKRVSGPQKAAMALLAMGEEASALILKKLSTEEIKQLSVHMSSLAGVRKDTSDELLEEFSSLFKVEGGVNVDGDQFIRNLLPSVMRGDQANEVISRMEEAKQRVPFKHLKDVDPKLLAGFIKGEHPQTIAIIVTHLGHQKASQVLAYLPEQLQFEIVTRIASLEAVPPELIMEVDEVLEKELSSVGTRGQQIGGVSVVAEILNHSDRRTGDSILQFLDETDSDLAEKVRKLMFVFEDLLHVNDGGIRELLKEVRNEELTVALKTASEDLKGKIFRNLSQRAAQMLQEDMSMMGPARLSEVENAQQAILVVARRLEKEGKLLMAGKDGGEQFV
ncbi:MAG: flagellar motor switch protein FliG [Syntrophobacteraceae bacterium]|nr:flagellar motor switch protein FliG [Syntrophobacteraceae bacterium]